MKAAPLSSLVLPLLNTLLALSNIHAARLVKKCWVVRALGSIRHRFWPNFMARWQVFSVRDTEQFQETPLETFNFAPALIRYTGQIMEAISETSDTIRWERIVHL